MAVPKQPNKVITSLRALPNPYALTLLINICLISGAYLSFGYDEIFLYI